MAFTAARRCAGVACLIAYLSACTSWHTVKEPPERVIPRDRPSPVRVTTEGGQQVLQNPEIRAGTLAGILEEGDSVRVPLDDLWSLEVRKTSTAKTIGLVYLIVATVATVALFAVYGDPVPDFGDGG